MTAAVAWLDGTLSPASEEIARLREVIHIVERLTKVMRADCIPAWLRGAVPGLGLDNDSPLCAITARGYRNVVQLIAGLEDPGGS